MTERFYDELADDYHTIFQDWDASIARQGEVLKQILAEEGLNESSSLLDCSCGIGTQALALALKGFQMTASDISGKSIDRAKKEAEKRKLTISFFQADMKSLTSVFSTPFDAILSIDNAIPHILTNEDCSEAFKEIHSLLKPGGKFIFSIRDYDAILKEKPASTLPVHRGNTVTFQLWDWYEEGNIYNLKHFTLLNEKGEWNAAERVSEYRAYKRAELTELLEESGFHTVKWLFPENTGFYQPIAIAYK